MRFMADQLCNVHPMLHGAQMATASYINCTARGREEFVGEERRNTLVKQKRKRNRSGNNSRLIVHSEGNSVPQEEVAGNGWLSNGMGR